MQARNFGEPIRFIEFELIVETIPDAVVVIDRIGRIVFANRAAEIVLGLSRSEITARVYNAPEWKLMTLDGRPYPEGELPFDLVIRSGNPVYNVELSIGRPDGKQVILSVNAVPVRDTKGNIASVVVSFTDITARKQEEDLSDALNRINAAITATLDADVIMNIVVNESVKAMGTEQAGIVLREGNHWIYKHLYGFPPELIGTRLTNEEMKFAILVAETKRPVVSNDALNDKRFDPAFMQHIGIRSLVATPLEIHGNIIGILFYSYHSAAIPFTAAQVDFATKLCASTSLALENAHLYSLKKEIADTMQETLLTVPAYIEGVEFSHIYRPSSEVSRVGGDFYDLFTLKGNKVGIAVGDISGTGVQAAILASMVKNAIRAYAYEDGSPSQVMSKTNELIRGTTGPGLFVTVFFGVLDIETGRLVYCSAGHPPAILMRKTQRKTSETMLLITSSPILGAFPSLNFIDDEEMIGRGDVLVLYTDGVTEARCRSGMFFGEEQLVSLMRSLAASVSVKDIPNAIFQSVIKCTGGIIADDIVILSLGLANR